MMSNEHEFDTLVEELRRLRPQLHRQRDTTGEHLDAGFKRALRSQLTAVPQSSPMQDVAMVWHTFIAFLVPTGPQLNLRGSSSRLATYTADDLTIAFTVLPAEGAADTLISLYGEVDCPASNVGLAGATVEVLRGEAVVATATPDELGTFVLSNLPPHVYAMRLRFPDHREVIVPPTSYDTVDHASLE